MKTEQEKIKQEAKELVAQFMSLGLDLKTAKKCSLIAIKEILKSKPTFKNNGLLVDYLGNTESELYYYNLREQIQNL